MMESSLLKIKRKGLCKLCIKPEKYYGPFDDGICSTCMNEDTYGKSLNKSEKIHLIETTDKLLRKASIEDKPIAIGVSGGKDSTLLVKKVIDRCEELGVNNKILCITVRIPTESKNLIPNLKKFKKMSKSLNFPIEFYEIKPSFNLYQFYKDIILSNKIIVNIQRTYEVCHICSDLLESLVIKKAIELGSNLIFFGLSPDETNRFIGRIPNHKLNNGLFPKKLENLLDQKVQNDFYHPNWGNVNVLFPFHYWNYNEKEAKEKSLKYIEESDPIKTNCSLVYLNMLLDLFTLGKMAYIESYSHLVRTGAMSRSDGITYLNTFLYLVKNKDSYIWREHINPILEKFELEFDELIKIRKEIIVRSC